MIRFFLIFCFAIISGVTYSQRIFKGLEPSSVITYTSKDTSYSFHVTNEKITNLRSSTYYWFGQGDIRSTQGGYSGKLIDGVFEKFNRKNALIEKGEFENGLKEGTWTKWYPNGKFLSQYRWRNGQRDGDFEEFHPGGGRSEERSVGKV